jgi:LacI family xylobiose transport system transcriptional regulator
VKVGEGAVSDAETAGTGLGPGGQEWPGGQEGPGTATLATVAAFAGVSVPTVSRVLNGRGQVAASTRRRVEEALQLHGYRRRSAPRSQSRELDLVFPELERFWALEIIRGVERVAQVEGLHLVLTEARGRRTPGATWLADLVERRPRCVVLVFSPDDAGAVLASRGIPFVVLDPLDEPRPDVVSIGSTNYGGGRIAAQHLLDLGHRRIATITGPPRAMPNRARVAGFTAAIESAGLVVDPSLVVEGNWSVESGYDVGLRLLSRPDRPTAVFSGNDLQALGLFRAARELGLDIPRDVSVVGYDDLPEAGWMWPPLTTVRQPLEAMAGAAATVALRLADGQEPLSRRLELASELVLRRSTTNPDVQW